LVSTAVLVVPAVDEKTAVRFRELLGPGAKFVPFTVAVMQCGPVTGFVALTDASDDGGPRVSVGAFTPYESGAVWVGGTPAARMMLATTLAEPAVDRLFGSTAVNVNRPVVPVELVTAVVVPNCVRVPAASVTVTETGTPPVTTPVTVIGAPTGPAVGLIDAVSVWVSVKLTGADGPIV
jgi:hypothetical protein